jgi:hypothetical protein
MSCHRRVTEWTTIIRMHLPQLSAPQATVLALSSVGMVLARSCALTVVVLFLAVGLHRKEQTVRQQLREFCDEAEAKRGTPRQALAVDPCVVPLRWVLSGWQGTPWALALNATTLGPRFTVLAVSAVYRGCAIPMAWTILPANQPHAWRRDWRRMLRQLRPAGRRDRPLACGTGTAPLARHHGARVANTTVWTGSARSLLVSISWLTSLCMLTALPERNVGSR